MSRPFNLTSPTVFPVPLLEPFRMTQNNSNSRHFFLELLNVIKKKNFLGCVSRFKTDRTNRKCFYFICFQSSGAQFEWLELFCRSISFILFQFPFVQVLLFKIFNLALQYQTNTGRNLPTSIQRKTAHNYPQPYFQLACDARCPHLFKDITTYIL